MTQFASMEPNFIAPIQFPDAVDSLVGDDLDDALAEVAFIGFRPIVLAIPFSDEELAEIATTHHEIEFDH